ncbi:PTS sugar transporter subunit IIA [Vagococcus acidifermentans]|uniref:PTS mannose transporter subunit IID n=1 Tax=Vagococcus acidifermentans TaxID=564710 RepID=A0A430B2V5_9ENTE|nr:PTS sugar transporter subunit IIA [Vagococcus acidifermentans]RSU14638.1 PTS mannose transporter subunit IID [Vagococcus acidifermentans]
MQGILIVTHGKMAEGLMDSLELIMGAQSNYRTLSLCHGDNINLFAEQIQEEIKALDTGSGVIVFADLFSASPYNQTAMGLKHLTGQKVRLISGVNLPMLVEAFNQRMLGTSLDDMYKSVMSVGKDGIKEFFEELERV